MKRKYVLPSKILTTLFLTLCSAIVLASFVYQSQIHFKAEFPSGTLTYKLTIEVQTPEGLVTAAGVREIVIDYSPNRNQSLTHMAYGEAFVIDLKERGKAFVLMQGALGSYDNPALMISAVFKCNTGKAACLSYWQSLPSIKREIEPVNYPMILAFSMPDDLRTSILLSEPVRIEGQPGVSQFTIDNSKWPVVFGQGVALRSVSIQVNPPGESVCRGGGAAFTGNWREYGAWLVTGGNFTLRPRLSLHDFGRYRKWTKPCKKPSSRWMSIFEDTEVESTK